MTTVPAKMSPSRLPFADSSEQISAWRPYEQPYLDHCGKPTHQRLPESFRTAVVAHHPKAKSELS